MAYDWNSIKESLQTGITGGKDFDDPREWKLQRDSDENGLAVIRLLPGKGGTTPPIVRIYEHSIRMFHKPTEKYRWYIHPSPQSIGLECPASDIYFELGKIGTDESKKLQKEISRSTKFISNILVVNDPTNPENNGKVFYWKYGVKLFEKFQAALEPTEAQQKIGKKPVELFDPMNGANITLVTKKLAGFVNYDDTTIDVPSPAFADQATADQVIQESCLDLTEFISPDYYSSYEELLNSKSTGLRRTLAGSRIEELLLQFGSNVIKEPYNENAKEGQEQANTAGQNGAIPTMGQSMQQAQPTAPTQPVQPTAPTQPAQPTQPVVNEAPAQPVQPTQPVVNETPAQPVVNEAPAQSSPSEEDEIAALLNDL